MSRFDIGDGIVLSKVAFHDADELFALVDTCRAYLREWMPWIDATGTVEDVLDFVDRSRKQDADRQGFQCCIRADREMVGVIGFVEMKHREKRTGLGYWMGAQFQGRGIMTKAVHFFTDYAFSSLNLDRVEIEAGIGNEKSQSIAERLGFLHEGILSERLWVNDHFVDLVLYAMLRKDWPVQRTA